MSSIKECLIAVMQYGNEVYVTNQRIIMEDGSEIEPRLLGECCIKNKNARVLARFGELYAAYAFECMGYEIAWPEIDDHGIDFIAVGKDRRLCVQVKTVSEGNYAFIKEKNINNIDYVAHIRVDELGRPELFVFPVDIIIRSRYKQNGKPKMFHYHIYEKDNSEYGITAAKKNFENSEYRIGEKGGWEFKRDLPI